MGKLSYMTGTPEWYVYIEGNTPKQVFQSKIDACAVLIEGIPITGHEQKKIAQFLSEPQLAGERVLIVGLSPTNGKPKVPDRSVMRILGPRGSGDGLKPEEV